MITTYVSEINCRCCEKPMEAMSRPETTQTNSAGQTRIIAASTVITCKTAGCTLEWQTFEASTYAETDLSIYGAVTS